MNIPYSRAFSFSGFQANKPKDSLPGTRVDVELDNIAQALKSTVPGPAGSGGLSVKSYGAKLDGTDDTAALAAARSAASVDGVISVPAGQWQRTADPTAGPATAVLWQMSGNKYGASQVAVNGVGKDTVETFLDGGKFITRAGTIATSGPALRVDSNVTHTDGPAGVHSTFGVNTIANVNIGNGAFVWSINNILTSRIPATGGGGAQAGGQTVGNANMSLRPADALADGLGPRSPLWGHLSQAEDRTGQPSNISGVLINQEWNLAASEDDPNNSRIMHHMTVNRPGDGQNNNKIGGPARVGFVSLIDGEAVPAVPGGSFIGSGYTVRIGWDTAALDTSQGFAINNAPAIKLAPDQSIAFDGTPTNASRRLRYSSGGLIYSSPNGTVFTAFDTGDFSVAGFLLTPALRIPDGVAPGSTADPQGTVGDIRFSGQYMYRKTSSGWLRSAAFSTF